MILGRLLKPPTLPEHPSPIVVPLIDVTVELPRFSVSRTFPLLVDTGADDTCLHLRDAFRLLGSRRYSMLTGPIREIIGVGGSQEYFSEQAWITFEHHNGTLESYEFDIGIAVPFWGDPERLALQFRLPSVLGWDLLQYFRLVTTYSQDELYLEHVGLILSF